ncbi:MAG: hypothetical protein FJ126_11570 [Deltaproteobacteria bacterium]|nr:hypothetical protein [Deltaproteobacteria bacterium]
MGKRLFPKTMTDLFSLIAKETARMSYPGKMNNLVKEGMKKALEDYFAKIFPLGELWDNSNDVVNNYDEWHRLRVKEIGGIVNNYNKVLTNNPEAMGAKFLNTFMHQLMKYDKFRPLFKKLHLPLDRRVFNALKSLRVSSLTSINTLLKRPPYSINYEEYEIIQKVLWSLIKELNNRIGIEFKVESRIELNLLWI